MDSIGSKPRRRMRPSTGRINYPKKRVSVACQVCRSRKTRCDAAKPSCGFCNRLGILCVYRDELANVATGPIAGYSEESNHDSCRENREQLMARLGRIESLLTLSAQSSPSIAGPASSPLQESPLQQPSPQPSTSHSLLHSLPAKAIPPLAQPPSTYGFQLDGFTHLGDQPSHPALAVLCGYDVEEQLEIETRAGAQLFEDAAALFPPPLAGPDMPLSSLLDLRPRLCWQLKQVFVAEVLPWYPIMDCRAVVDVLSHATDTDFDQTSLETCLSLLILALGCFAQGRSETYIELSAPPGIRYFFAACRIADYDRSAGDTILYIQCHILMCIYLQYCLLPIQAYEAVTRASHKVMMLLSRPRLLEAASSSHASLSPGTSAEKNQQHHNHHLRELCHRAYWACYLIEHELQAYVSYSSRAIQEHSDFVPLPVSDYEEPGMYWFLSEIALRRIFQSSRGGIAWCECTLYAPVVVGEINAQMMQWHSNLARPVAFPLDEVGVGGVAVTTGRVRPLMDPRKTFLRAQFYALLATTHWSFVVRILSSPPQQEQTKERSSSDGTIVTQARKAVEYAMLHIFAVEPLIEDRHPMLLTNITGLLYTTSLALCTFAVPELAEIQHPKMPEALYLSWRCLKAWDRNPGVRCKLKKLEDVMRSRGLDVGRTWNEE